MMVDVCVFDDVCCKCVEVWCVKIDVLSGVGK